MADLQSQKMSYHAAREARSAGEAYLALIGKQSVTATYMNVGKLHKVSVKTQIHYQPYDGAKNYHESTEFDLALAVVIERNFPKLALAAVGILKAREASEAVKARNEVKELLRQLDEIVAEVEKAKPIADVVRGELPPADAGGF